MSTVKGRRKENKQFKQYTCLFSDGAKRKQSLNNDGLNRNSRVCQYFHGQSWNRNHKPKRNQTARLETLHRRHILPLEHKQRRNNTVHWTSKETPPYNQIHGWSFRYCWYNFLGHHHLQRRKIRNKISSWCANTLQAYWDISRSFNIHISRPEPTRRCQKGIWELLRTNSSETLFEKKIKTFKTHLAERGYPKKTSHKYSFRKTDHKPSNISRRKIKESCRL